MYGIYGQDILVDIRTRKVIKMALLFFNIEKGVNISQQFIRSFRRIVHCFQFCSLALRMSIQNVITMKKDTRCENCEKSIFN